MKHRVETYHDGVKLLRGLYTSEENLTRLLNQWTKIKLTESFGINPYISEIDAFKEFTDDPMFIQQQLHDTYHTDHQSRDGVFTAVDVPSLQ